jgi:pimeloyl-ACP methyl ester carboxylesterase
MGEGRSELPKHSQPSAQPPPAVRTRRAYFDWRFGQLHVRTAFPTTGGFDERVTLVCLHSTPGTSRMFHRLLPLMAIDRSIYAPDLPGAGESDPAPEPGIGRAAAAVADLIADLRLRQIDLLGFLDGCLVASKLAQEQPAIVRRLVLVGAPAGHPLPAAPQQSLVLREFAGDVLEAAPELLVGRMRAFL